MGGAFGGGSLVRFASTCEPEAFSGRCGRDLSAGGSFFFDGTELL